MEPSEVNSAPRQEHGFLRTVCGCAFCRIPCRHVPGGLDPADLTRLCPEGQDVFVWAEEHLRARVDLPYPTLVPAQQSDGSCHWLIDGQCVVHDHAPYGCAFFDSHQSASEVEQRYAATVQRRQDDAAVGGFYFRIWGYLCRRGLITRPGKRSALVREVRQLLDQSRRLPLGLLC